MKRFRAYYGAHPLHLVATIGGLVIVGGAFADWFHARTHIANILLWFIGAFVVVEFVLIPLVWVLDRIARASTAKWPRRLPRGAGQAYVRVPALLSGVLLIASAPVIFRADAATYRAYTGSTPWVYLGRWLVATAIMFACSALLYVIALARSRRSARAGTGDHVQAENDAASAPTLGCESGGQRATDGPANDRSRNIP